MLAKGLEAIVQIVTSPYYSFRLKGTAINQNELFKNIFLREINENVLHGAGAGDSRSYFIQMQTLKPK